MENLTAVVIDRASNYQAAGRQWDNYNVWCFCHRLHLVAKDILGCSVEVRECYQGCKDEHFNKSHTLTNSLTKSLKKSGDTRWNSASVMFKSFLDNKMTLPNALMKTRLNISLDWDLIEFLHDLLKFLALTLERLEADKVPTMNVVIPCVYTLERNWKDMKEDIGFEDYELIIEKSILALNDRIPKEKWPNCALLACWLDPRYSRFKFISNPESRKKVVEFCQHAAMDYITVEKEKSKPSGRDTFI